MQGIRSTMCVPLLGGPAAGSVGGPGAVAWPVAEDALRHGFVLDHGDHAHGPTAAGADHDVDRERPRQEPRPVQPARAIRVIGTVRKG